MVCVPKNPDDLSPKFLSTLFEDHYGTSSMHVASLEVRPIVEGVLSQVVEIYPMFSNSDDSSEGHVGIAQNTTRRFNPSFVAKFNRRDMPQDRMFQIEGAFYSHHAASLAEEDEGGGGGPFAIPKAVFCSPDCIILERVDDSYGESTKLRRYRLVEGCPVEETDGLVRALAKLHAYCWTSSSAGSSPSAAERFRDLSASPGIGMSLPGVAKERLFTLRWKEFLSNVSDCGLSTEELDKARVVCSKLAKRQLRRVHEQVLEFRPTLIHGDFHAANILFAPERPAEAGGATRRCWLLDWAASGAGNPLFDLVFFLVVSSANGAEDPHETERLLKLYHDSLTDPKACEGSTAIITELPYDKLRSMYRVCVVNEFLILVAYDRLSRKFIETTQEPVAKKERREHFSNVNRRCLRALISPAMDFASFPLPPVKTDADLLEDKEAALNGALLGMNL